VTSGEKSYVTKLRKRIAALEARSVAAECQAQLAHRRVSRILEAVHANWRDRRHKEAS
jgi:hypothetical protein